MLQLILVHHHLLRPLSMCIGDVLRHHASLATHKCTNTCDYYFENETNSCHWRQRAICTCSATFHQSTACWGISMVYLSCREFVNSSRSALQRKKKKKERAAHSHAEHWRVYRNVIPSHLRVKQIVMPKHSFAILTCVNKTVHFTTNTLCTQMDYCASRWIIFLPFTIWW